MRGQPFGQTVECMRFVFARFDEPGYIPPATPPSNIYVYLLSSSATQSKMRFSTVILAVFTLATSGLAETTCTPSFDYCSDVLIKDKGESRQVSLYSEHS